MDKVQKPISLTIFSVCIAFGFIATIQTKHDKFCSDLDSSHYLKSCMKHIFIP
jgi:hypothetical protein